MAKKILSKRIDVSYANGKINWESMKKNIDWAILRTGYGRDYTNQDDAQWKNNVAGCEKNNIPYGVYHYSYATTVEAAKSEAKHAIRLLKGHKPGMPVFFDLEEARISQLGKAKILAIAKAFCAEIEKAGFQYGTYANKNWFQNYLTDKWYDNYPKWIAQYNSTCTYTGKYDIWQYSSSGTFSGYKCKFDMNYGYTSFLKGDVDGDGNVTAADARKILRTSSNLEKLSGQEKVNADVNGDGKITAADARDALRKSAKLDK